MSSQGVTTAGGVGITGLKIKLLRIPVSTIDPDKVFEKGRVIYGTTDDNTSVISDKVGDGTTIYSALQELFLQSGNLTTVSNGQINLGGTANISATLNLSSFTLSITQGLLFSADYTTYFNANDRAIIDAGYFRANQNYKRWVSGSTISAFNLLSNSTNGTPELYLAKANITAGANTVNPTLAQSIAFGSDQTAGVNTYNSWVAASNNFTVIDGNYLFIQNSVNLLPTGSGMATYPLFSKPIGGLQRTGGDRFEFTISGDTNDAINFVNRYVFFASSIPISPVQTWYELPPYEKDVDVIINSTSSYQYKIHIDVARDSSNQNFEFRARIELLVNSGNPGAVQLMELEFKDSNAVAFFNSRAIPSNYWKIKGQSTDPNTLLNQWLGTETNTIPELATNTFGTNTPALYAIKTRGGSVIVNNTATTNLFTFLRSGTQVGYIDNNGAIYAPSINNPASAFNASIMLNTGGVGIKRGVNDAGNVLVVQNNSASFSGSLLNVADYLIPAFKIGQGGDNTTYINPYTTTVSGFQTQVVIGGVIVPTANNDTEVGLDISTVFGTSKIATVDTLVGGTGYPNTATVALSTGGTGLGAVFSITVSGGVIQSAVPLRPGANYTVNDVLTLQCFVGGILTGTGGTVTVRTLISYTGIKSYAIRVAGAPILTAPSTSSYSSIIVAQGAGYTGTTSGAMWQDGTHLYAYIGGAITQLDRQPGSGSSAWGSISGTLSTQSDLNTALNGKSPLVGSTSIITLGIVTSGTWNAGIITDAYISSSGTWNAKMNNPMTTVGDLIVGGTVTAGLAAPARLPMGTSNQIPSVNTGGTALEYRTLSTSGGLGGGFTTGLINLFLQDTIPTIADANITSVSTGNFSELPTITANRTINMFSASSAKGQKMSFLSTNTSGFTWSFIGSGVVTDTLGNIISVLTTGLLYCLESDGTNWVWMDNTAANTQNFVAGVFVGSVNPTTPTPGSAGNPFTIGQVIGIGQLTATGSPSATTFHRGDNTWATYGAWTDTNSTTTLDPLVTLTNTVASTGSTNLFSPAIRLRTQFFNASTDKTADFLLVANNNSSTAVSQFLLQYSLAAGTPTTLFSIDRFGSFNISGKMVVSSTGIGTTTPDGAVLNNVTAADNAGGGTLQGSTLFRQQGSVYNSTSTIANYVSFGTQVSGVSAAVPTGRRDWYGGIGTTSTVSLTRLMSLDTNGNLSLLTGALKITSPQSSVTGSTSGTAVFSQPQQGGAMKMVVINLTALVGTASYTYPTAFINTPVILTTNGLAASIAGTPSTTLVTVTGTTSTGILILMGY